MTSHIDELTPHSFFSNSISPSYYLIFKDVMISGGYNKSTNKLSNSSTYSLYVSP